MKNKYTLKELADIGARAANIQFTIGIYAAQDFTQAILDAIGYEFPVDEEREAFHAWYQSAQIPQGETQAFAAWKAGREELRKAMPMFSFDKNITITTEPAWIPWHGGSNPIVGEQTKYEIEIRNGERFTCAANDLRWSHDGSIGDIIAYRIL